MDKIIFIAVVGYVFLTVRGLDPESNLAWDNGYRFILRIFLASLVLIGATYCIAQVLIFCFPQQEIISCMKEAARVHLKDDRLLAYVIVSIPLAVVFGTLNTPRIRVAVRVLVHEWSVCKFKKGTKEFFEILKEKNKILVDPELIGFYNLVGAFVLLTLENGKVYVGILEEVKLFGSIPYDEKTIIITPIISGYRDVTTLKVTYTTDYNPTNGKEEISLTIYLKYIVSYSRFNLNAHHEFINPNKKKLIITQN